MKNTDIITKIRIGIEAAFIAVFVILCVAVAKKNQTIRRQKEALEFQCGVTDSLQRTVNDLASMDCIRVETSCIINNKGLVNVSQTNQISKTIATYTRGEVLMAMDSLKRANNDK